MVTRHSRNNVTWVDLESPTAEELSAVMDEFGVSERVEEEIITPTPYPIVLSGPKYVYLILHFPTAHPDGSAHGQEIDFVVGKNFVITVRYEVVESILSLHRVFETEALLDLPNGLSSADHITERVLRHMYGAIRTQAEQAALKMDRIEDNIFTGQERRMVREISLVARVLLRFDSTLTTHAEPLKAFLEHLSKTEFFGKDFIVHTKHIQGEYEHTASLIGSFRATLRELRITNDSLLSSRQNEVMTRLTIITVLVLPLTVITGYFGMNNRYLPFVDSTLFPLGSVLLMLIAVIGTLLFFRARNWF